MGLDWAAQSFIQSDFQSLQGWRWHDLSRKHFACLTVLIVKKDFCKVRKVTGWERSTHWCSRKFTASSAMMLSFLNSTDEVSHKAFPQNSQDYPGHVPSDGHNQVNADNWHSVLLPLALPFPCSLSALLWSRGDYSLVLGQMNVL